MKIFRGNGTRLISNRKGKKENKGEAGRHLTTQINQDGKRGPMNKDRLECIMSGLNQYQLTKMEDQFVKSALGDFDQNHALTGDTEERLESLYKEKSNLAPNKKSSDYFSFKESSPKKAKPRRPRARMF